MVFNKKRRRTVRGATKDFHFGSAHTSRDAVSNASSSLNGSDSVPPPLKGILKNTEGANARRSNRIRRRAGGSVDTSSVKDAGSKSTDRSQGSRLSTSLHVRSAQNSVDSNLSTNSDPSSIRNKENSHHEDIKGVRFERILVREFERVVGDNPSCSSGPPIGIGWAHTETQRYQLDHYEEHKHYRNRRLRLVLTREEREEMLLQWDVSLHDMIDAIRINIKVKNQRRQTVTNLGKVERLEEALESASRKLKRVVTFKRRPREQVKALRTQANQARRDTYMATHVEGCEMPDESHLQVGTRPEFLEADEKTRTSSDGVVNNYDPTLKTPSDSKISQNMSSMADEKEDSESGFSLGNSTSASIREMENFYRELELEMFGEELPSLEGLTLELPTCDIPEDERVYDDPESMSQYREPPSVAANDFMESDHWDSGSNFIRHSEVNMYLKSASARALAHETFTFIDDRPPHPTESRFPTSKMPNAHHHEYADSASHVPPFHHVPPHRGYYTNVDSSHQHGPHDVHSGSLDDNGVIDHHTRAPADHPQFLFPPQPFPGVPIVGRSPANHQTGYQNGSPSYQKFREQSRPRDSPEIRHVPPPMHLSPSHWMEQDCDEPRVVRDYTPVTISEDDVSEPRFDRYHNQNRPEPGWGYQPPLRYPSSFY